MFFACFTKFNEVFVIHTRKKERWYPHVTIIKHVAIYEKTPWKYCKCFFNAIACGYIVTYSSFDLIFILDERECVTTSKYQSYHEHAKCE